MAMRLAILFLDDFMISLFWTSILSLITKSTNQSNKKILRVVAETKQRVQMYNNTKDSMKIQFFIRFCYFFESSYFYRFLIQFKIMEIS